MGAGVSPRAYWRERQHSAFTLTVVVSIGSVALFAVAIDRNFPLAELLAASGWFAAPWFLFNALDATAILRRIDQGDPSPDRQSFTFTQTVINRYGFSALYFAWILLATVLAATAVVIA